MNEVTDPNLLAQLEEPEEVTDPALLAQLEESEPEPIEDTRIDMDAEQSRDVAPWESTVQGFRDAATFGVGNELSAAAGSVYDKFSSPEDYNKKTWGETYDENLASMEDSNVQAQVQNPDAYTGGEVAGVGATALIPGMGIAGKGVTGTAKLAKAAADKVARIPLRGAEAVGQTFPMNVIKGIAQKKVAPVVSELGAATAKGTKLGDKVTRGLFGAKTYLPETAMEAVGALIGHTVVPVAGAVAGKHTVRMTGDKLGQAGTRFANKYGQWVGDLAERGTGAITANVFVRQQSDPEFNAALKAAKLEAAEESTEEY